MRRIAIRILIMFLFVFVLFITLEVLSINEKTYKKVAELFGCEDYISNGSGLEEIGAYIEGAQKNDGTDCLVIGDSIARQFFSEVSYDGNVSVQCSNAAICITGQYMLAHEWLKTHEDAKEIYLFMHPTSLTRTYDTEWTYPYVVIPFGLYGLLENLDNDTIKDMGSVYGHLFMKKPVIRLINDSPLNRKLYLNFLKRNKSDYAQQNSFDISSRYIGKIKAECDERGVKLYLISTPSTDYQKSTIDRIKEEYMDSNLFNLFPNYLKDIYYFSSDYSNDYQHLSEEYATREFMDSIIKEAYLEKNYSISFIK